MLLGMHYSSWNTSKLHTLLTCYCVCTIAPGTQASYIHYWHTTGYALQLLKDNTLHFFLSHSSYIIFPTLLLIIYSFHLFLLPCFAIFLLFLCCVLFKKEMKPVDSNTITLWNFNSHTSFIPISRQNSNHSAANGPESWQICDYKQISHLHYCYWEEFLTLMQSRHPGSPFYWPSTCTTAERHSGH